MAPLAPGDGETSSQFLEFGWWEVLGMRQEEEIVLQLEIDINMFYLTYKYKGGVVGGPQEAG